MATKICHQCRSEADVLAKVCPQCKAKLGDPGKNGVAKKPTHGCVWLIAVFGGIGILGGIFGGNSPTPPSNNNPTTAKAIDSEETASQATQKNNWEYEQNEDKMGRGVIKYAMTKSTNTLSFDFPYQGLQHGTLTIRKHPEYGKDVIVQIEKGQFLTGIDGCAVKIRFDNGKSMAFHANGPSDHGTTSIFITGYSTIVENIKKSKTMFVEAPFYQEGRQVIEFDVSGLQW